MLITVVGLGYVGTVAAACLAESDHVVRAIDVDVAKVDAINAGLSPVVEPGLAELVANNVRKGRLSADTDLVGAARRSDVTIICVGTPTAPSGITDLDALDDVAAGIGSALRTGGWRLVLVTSTVPAGATEQHVIPRLERESGMRCGVDFGVAFSPEFLREGSAVLDYQQPARTVIGASDPEALRQATELLRPYGSDITATTIAIAEMVKLASNTWHGLKVGFANEIGRLCAALELDSHAVMDIIKSDTRLNISPAYLTPGFAFGGPCLAKDIRALAYQSQTLDARTPIIDAILPSNEHQIEHAVRRIRESAAERVAVLGLAFKPHTGDLRGSPIIDLVDRLLEEQLDVVVHDEQFDGQGVGDRGRPALPPAFANIRLCDLDLAVKDADVVVVAQPNPAYARITEMARSDQLVIDLCGVARPTDDHDGYSGLSW
jgi:GDP-mannose 6-dehydrogenase